MSLYLMELLQIKVMRMSFDFMFHVLICIFCLQTCFCFRWSFGVVLWEIVTLGADIITIFYICSLLIVHTNIAGGNPYPNMNRDDVIDSLQRGYRMPKPTHCSDEV